MENQITLSIIIAVAVLLIAILVAKDKRDRKNLFTNMKAKNFYKRRRHKPGFK